MEIASYWLAVAVIAALAWMLYRTMNSWLAPPTIANLVWVAYAIGAAAFAEDIGALQPASTVVMCALLASTGGAYLVSRRHAERVGSLVRDEISARKLRAVGVSLLIAGMAELFWILSRAGFSARELAAATVIADITAANRNAYGYGDLKQSIPERILVNAAYAAPLFTSFTWTAFRRRRDGALSITSLLLICAIAMLYGSRMGALFGGALFIGGFLAGHLYSGGRATDRTGSRLVLTAALFAVVVLVGISTFTMVVRYYSAGAPPVSALVQGPFGFLPALAYWIRDFGVPWLPETLGFYTFERAARTLGWGALPAVASTPVGFTESNIYTMFRALLEDFGMIGTLSLAFISGAVSTQAYYRATQGNATMAAIAAASYAVTICSVALSPLAYNSPLLSMTGFVIFISIAARRSTTMIPS